MIISIVANFLSSPFQATIYKSRQYAHRKLGTLNYYVKPIISNITGKQKKTLEKDKMKNQLFLYREMDF